MTSSAGPRTRLQSEINVTPLVDVCLVMLIIFMVVTPILTGGPNVLLPEGSDPACRPQRETQRAITVTWQEPPRCLLDARELDETELSTELEEMFRQAPATELVLKADRRLAYRDVKRMMRRAREAGFQEIGLIAERIRPEPEG
jgi:biopolymer transport protein ExbD